MTKIEPYFIYLWAIKQNIMSETRQIEILDFIQNRANCSSGEIHKKFANYNWGYTKMIVEQSWAVGIRNKSQHLNQSMLQKLTVFIYPADISL